MTLENRPEAPKCTAESNFMTPLGRQVFAAVGASGAVTEVEIDDGERSLDPIAEDARGGIAAFVRERL